MALASSVTTGSTTAVTLPARPVMAFTRTSLACMSGVGDYRSVESPCALATRFPLSRRRVLVSGS